MPRRSSWSWDQLDQICRAQHGLATAAQIAQVGIPRATVSYRNGLGGMFTRVLPGVHLLGFGMLSEDQRDFAALLYAGTDAALTGRSALLRLDVRAARRPEFAPDDRVHVLVPANRQRASHGFVSVERTHVMTQPTHKDGFAMVPVARAVLDAARRCRSSGGVRMLVAEVIQRSLTTVEALADELASGSIRGSAFPRRAIEEVAAGIRSVPEGDLRREYIDRGLEQPLWNPELRFPNGRFLCCPDGYFKDVGVVAEVDSVEYHSSPVDWQATMRRHSAMTSAGLIVLHFSPSRIRDDIDGVLHEISETVRRAEGRTLPDLIVIPSDRPVNVGKVQ